LFWRTLRGKAMFGETLPDAARASEAQGREPPPLQMLGLYESQLECSRELVALRVCLL
jgi:hypothetical protein